MKILVTGSESFVGQELIKQCLDQNISVIGLDIVKKSNLNYSFYSYDIRDENIHEIIPEKLDAMIHLAAFSNPYECKGKPILSFDINVMGTLNLIKNALKKNTQQFIFASSEWVYGDFHPDEEKDENSSIHIEDLTSEYALSKLVSESNLRQQFLQGFCDTTILRFGIIYGPRENNWGAVESIAHTVKTQNEVIIGSKKNGRRFIHVSDIASGIIKSLGLKGFNIINLSGNEMIILDKLITTCEKLYSKKVKTIEKDPLKINIRNPSNSKAKKLLNWEPQIKLAEGLQSLNNFL